MVVGGKNRFGGFTLAEAMMAVVVLGIAAGGVLLPYVSGASVRAEGERQLLAGKLASDLLEEVVATDFNAIISNYNYSESQGQVRDSQGNVYSGSEYAGFSRRVTTEMVRVSGEDTAFGAKFILTTVRVYYKGSEVVCLRRLISK